MSINVDTKNLAGVIFETAKRFPDKTALIYADESVTYGELVAEISELAASLEKMGIAASQRVGLMLYNERSFVLSYYALLALGVTVVPLSTRLKADEVSTVLKDAEATWLVTSHDFHETFSKIDAPELTGIIIDNPGALSLLFNVTSMYRFTDLLKWELETEKPLPYEVSPDTVATLIYTSGTTGKPKGVMLSHRNILADAAANVDVIAATDLDCFVTVSPLFHVFGQTNILTSGFMVGASVVLVKKFSPQKILEAIETHQVTFLAAVPTMYQMMMSFMEEFKAQRTFDLSSLRVCHSGAAPMLKEVYAQVEKVFGVPVQEGYGLSESSSIICSNPLQGPQKAGSVGVPIGGFSVKIFDEDRQECPAGEVGEIHVKGDVVMLGYYNQPEETSKALVEGWLKTGDFAYGDDEGYIFIVGRKDDMINVGGSKVYPREVEEVLCQYPAIDLAAVIGEGSDLYHQQVKCFVVAKKGEEIEAKKALAFCKEHLADYKVPVDMKVVQELPQGATGKILHRELR